MKRIEDLSDKDKQLELRSNFERDGFIFYPGFINKEEVDLIKSKIDEFIRKKLSDMPKSEVYYEDINDLNTLKQLQRLFTYDPFFFDMMFGSRFEKLASILLNDSVQGKNIQYFNKPPKIGKPTPPHQDGYYFMLAPNEAVTMWLALEEVNEINGCVRYVKESHKYGMRSHGRTKTLGFSQGISDYGCPHDLENEIFLPTKEGDLLVHHSLTIHRADGNKSERTRKAMGFIYYAEKAKEDKRARAAYEEELSRELSLEKKI